MLLLAGILLSIVPVASAQDAEPLAEEAVYSGVNGTYAPESAHVWTNKNIFEGSDLGKYYLDLEAWVDGSQLIIEENIPLDIVFCLDQSASMYKPAYAESDLNCNSSFGGSRTKPNTQAQRDATGQFTRAEFIQMMKDPVYQEKANHTGYFIARSAEHSNNPGSWFIITRKADGSFYSIRSCRTNQCTYNGATKAVCPEGVHTQNSQGGVTWASAEEIPTAISRFYITQYGVMYDALLAFVEAAKANSDKNGVDHRFAFTTFSGTSGLNENGSSIIIGQQRNTYVDITALSETAQDEIYSRALLSVRDNYDQVLASVETIKSDYSGTNTQAGIRLAKSVLNSTKDDAETLGRKRFVIVFTDGEPNMSISTKPANATEAELAIFCRDKAISEAYTIKQRLDTQVYAICTAGDRDGDFLKFVSSTYPEAVDMTTVGTPVDRIYYFLEKNAASVHSIFAEIRDKELLDRFTMAESIVMRDVIDPVFLLPEGGNITAYRVPYTGNGTFEADESKWDDITSTLTIKTNSETEYAQSEESAGEDVLEVSGYDYGTFCILDNADGTCEGSKLLVRVDVDVKPDYHEGLREFSNVAEVSGLYGEEGKIIHFANPSVDLPTRIFVKKTVEGVNAKTTDEFTFRVTAQKFTPVEGQYYTSIPGEQITKGDGYLVASGGNILEANQSEQIEEFKLSHYTEAADNLYTITNLVRGSYITIREEEFPGYVATIEYSGHSETAVANAKGEITIKVEPNMVIHFNNASYPAPDTVVMDKGLPMKIHVLANDTYCADGTLAAVGASGGSLTPTKTLNTDKFKSSCKGKYGSINVNSAGHLVYTPSSMQMSEAEVFTYVVTKQLESGTYYFYDTVTIVPATSIYYEDSFMNYTGNWGTAGTNQGGNQSEDRPGKFDFPDYDADRIYGYDPAYNASTTYSLGSARYASVSSKTFETDGAWPTAKFTFTGTGFDLISLTSNQTGFITCRVYKGTQTDTIYESWVVDTYYGYSRTIDQEYPWVEYVWTYNGQRWVGSKVNVAEKTREESAELITNPQEGDVVVFYKENYIWTPVDGNTPNDLYQIPVIKSPELDYGTYTVVITPTYIPFFDHTGNSGYDFYLDAVRIYAPAENMEDYYLQDGEAYPQYVELRKQLLTTDEAGNATGYVNGISFIDGVAEGLLADYDAYGPNNEIYLNPNQAIAFAIDSKGESIANVHVGVKIFDNPGTLTAAALDAKGNTLKEQTITTTSHTDLYYSISNTYIPVEGENISNVIVLTNTGSSPITLTTLKITYGEKPTADSELVMDLEKMQAAAGYVERKVTLDLPVLQELQLSMGHSVNFESDLQMNYRIKRDALEGYDLTTAYLVVEKDVYPTKGEAAVETYTLYPDLTSDAERMIFRLTGIQAAEMGSELRATLHIRDARGREVQSNADTYSILAYAKLCFERYSYEAQPAMYRLLMDSLNYGAAAQLYFGRRTDCLVNAGLEAYQQYATTELAEELNDSKVTTATIQNAPVSKLGFSVSFTDKTELNVKLTLTGSTAEITSVRVTDESGNLLATLSEFTELPDGRLQATYTGILATQLRQMFYFTAYSGEEVVSATCGYSVEAYARSCIYGSDQGLAQLVRSCMYYGDSALAYFAERGAESN